MEYARLEIRLVSGGWSSGTLITGLAGEGVRGVVVRPFDLVVTHTLLRGSRRRIALPPGSEIAGDARSPTAEGSVRLVKGAAVAQGGKRVGRVDALWCDRATGRLMHVLVRPSGGFLRRPGVRVLSAEEISEISNDGLLLGAGTAPVRALTPYRADKEIEADLRLAVAGALATPSARHGVKVLVEAGQVHLGGVVATEEQVTSVRRAVGRVRGVRATVDDLVSVETLGARVERQLAMVLAENGVGNPTPNGRGGEAAANTVRVLAEHGIVYLEGHVPSKEVRAALERAAAVVPGAHVVMNHLDVEMSGGHVRSGGAAVAGGQTNEAPADAGAEPASEDVSQDKSPMGEVPVHAGRRTIELPPEE